MLAAQMSQTSRLVSCSLSAKGITRPQRGAKSIKKPCECRFCMSGYGWLCCAMYWELYAKTPLKPPSAVICCQEHINHINRLKDIVFVCRQLRDAMSRPITHHTASKDLKVDQHYPNGTTNSINNFHVFKQGKHVRKPSPLIALLQL